MHNRDLNMCDHTTACVISRVINESHVHNRPARACCCQSRVKGHGLVAHVARFPLELLHLYCRSRRRQHVDEFDFLNSVSAKKGSTSTDPEIASSVI